MRKLLQFALRVRNKFFVLLQKAALPQSLIQKYYPEEFRNVFLFNSSLYERMLEEWYRDKC